jgi:flagellar L-ring protein precursor FlgH
MRAIKTTLLTLTLTLAGCSNTLDRLDRVGKDPEMAKIQNPQETPGYKDVTWPMPVDEYANTKTNANSLWRPGAKSFFRDQRARKVGDILTVKVTIDDEAQLDNETNSTRSNEENLGAPSVFGLETKYGQILPGNPAPDSLLSITGDRNVKGTGQINRKEKITTEVAALVTQLLPNGNMVIQGRQEIRVNSELREVGIAGVVRPEDIGNDNTIMSSQIAEARISYGGRGTLSDVQRPRYGSEILDIIAPF